MSEQRVQFIEKWDRHGTSTTVDGVPAAEWQLRRERDELRAILDGTAAALRRIAETEAMRAMTPHGTPSVTKSEVAILAERLTAILGRTPAGAAPNL